MSKLSEYIEKVKEYQRKNPNISEDMLVRYVYIDLGKRFSFDLEFSFGNTKTKQSIYARGDEDDLNEAMESNIVICKTVSYILEYILKSLGIDIITVVDYAEETKCPHMYNIVTQKDGKKYSIDLQEDMENIQSNSFTKNYGLSIDDEKLPVINRYNIEQMDRELGFIDNKHYYSDEYTYLLKLNMDFFEDFAEKVQFVLEHIDIYENKNIKYAERRWHHKQILRELFTKEELKKIQMIDCYQEVENEKIYKNCIAVNVSGQTAIYMYSVEENRYCRMTIQEFAKATQNGLVHLQGILGLRQALKELKQDGEGEGR